MNAFFFEGISRARNIPPTGTIAHSQQVRGLIAKSPLLSVQNQSSEGEGCGGGRMDGGKKKKP